MTHGLLNEVALDVSLAALAAFATNIIGPFPWAGQMGRRQRGPVLEIAISDVHTQTIRLRFECAQASGGPWFVMTQSSFVAGTPGNYEIRLPAAPWARVSITNSGAAASDVRAFVREVPDYRVR